jgi:hypothetical protein
MLVRIPKKRIAISWIDVKKHWASQVLDAKCVEELSPAGHPSRPFCVQNKHINSGTSSFCSVFAFLINAWMWRGDGKRIDAGFIIFDVHSPSMLSNPVIALMLIICKGCRGSIFEQTRCDTKATGTGPDDEDIVNVHCSRSKAGHAKYKRVDSSSSVLAILWRSMQLMKSLRWRVVYFVEQHCVP